MEILKKIDSYLDEDTSVTAGPTPDHDAGTTSLYGALKKFISPDGKHLSGDIDAIINAIRGQIGGSPAQGDHYNTAGGLAQGGDKTSYKSKSGAPSQGDHYGTTDGYGQGGDKSTYKTAGVGDKPTQGQKYAWNNGR